MDVDNIQIGSSSSKESINENRDEDDVTGKENTYETLHEDDVIKCLDLQYFDVQDAQNEIIVTTDREIEEEEYTEDVEEYMENYQEEGNGMKTNGQVFILPTLEDIKELIKYYCEQTSCRFVGQIKTKDFGLSSLECDLTGHRIQWQDIPHKNSANDIITFDGIPHICVGHYQFGCEFGTDLKASRKEKLQKMKDDGKSNVKSRNVKVPSKKCGCPAKILVRQIIKFPEFKILKNTEGRKRTGTTKLKERLKNNRGNVQSEVLYIGRLPHISEHKFHELMEGRELTKEMVHPELVVKVQELFLQNKSNLEIYELIRNYVLNEMFWKQDPPDSKRRRFFPKPIDIRNIVCRIRRLCRFSEEEEETIRTFIEETRKKYENASIFFDINETSTHEIMEDYIDVENSQLSESIQSNKNKKEKGIKLQTFIFCYQTHSQQWLIKRYSYLSYLVEMETDSNIKSALPYKMYCLVVQTNVDFQAVGIIIVSKQRKYGLIEGLKCFREWNIAWNPDYFLVDYSEDIQEAIATVFPKTTYFLNSQSCKREWIQFLNTPSNDLQEHSEELSICLESMQYALTEESLTIFATLLESNEVWKKNDNLRTWFQNSWLHSANKWVFGYRPDDLIVMQHMKISLDDCLQVYKEPLGKSAKTNGFFELIQEIINVISLQEYEKYIKRNNELHLFHKQYEKRYSFPEYMQGLQVSLYPYLEIILKVAKENDFIITHDQLGLFTVQLQQTEGEINSNHNHVDNENCIPSKNNLMDEVVCRNKEIILTKFSYVEYSNKLDTGEYTVSFGDSRSYPFCTCSHWKFYKLPCVHICAVCCKIPGWRYQMFSPLYRSNPIFEIDYSCLNNDFQKTEYGADSPFMNYDDTKLDIAGNIFESFLKVGANDVILEQANNFLQHINKMIYLFKDKTLYKKIHHQLTDFVERLETYLTSKNTGEKLVIPLSDLQSRSDNIALSIVNNLKINKSNINDILGTHPENVDGGRLQSTIKINDDDVLPRLQPISKDDQSKYVVCTLENTSSNSERKRLDLINFDITTSIRNPMYRNVAISSHLLSRANSGVIDASDIRNQVLTGVNSILLGKRVGSSMNSCTTNGVKRVKTPQTDILASSSTPEKILITNSSSKKETCVKLSSFT